MSSGEECESCLCCCSLKIMCVLDENNNTLSVIWDRRTLSEGSDTVWISVYLSMVSEDVYVHGVFYVLYLSHVNVFLKCPWAGLWTPPCSCSVPLNESLCGVFFLTSLVLIALSAHCCAVISVVSVKLACSVVISCSTYYWYQGGASGLLQNWGMGVSRLIQLSIIPAIYSPIFLLSLLQHQLAPYSSPIYHLKYLQSLCSFLLHIFCSV